MSVNDRTQFGNPTGRTDFGSGLKPPHGSTQLDIGCREHRNRSRKLRQGVQSRATAAQHDPEHVPHGRRARSEVGRLNHLVDERHIVGGQMHGDRAGSRLVGKRDADLRYGQPSAASLLKRRGGQIVRRSLLVSGASQRSSHPVRWRSTGLRRGGEDIGLEDFTQIHMNRRFA